MRAPVLSAPPVTAAPVERAGALPAILLLLLLAIGGATLSAQTVTDPELEARTSAVASELRCPVCQGVSIQDSPSELAQQMRAVVRDQLREGKTPQEVKAYFVASYGEWILLEPRASGLNLLLYVLPVVLVAFGLVLIVRAVRRWSGNAAAT